MSEPTKPGSGWSALCSAFAGHVKPRGRLSVWQWADKYRVLTTRASGEPGLWRTARVPYLREVMELLSTHSHARKVVVCFASQTAKTESLLNWIGYLVDRAPAPMLIVQPTLETMEKFQTQRVMPLLEETECLTDLFSKNRKDVANNQLIKQAANGAVLIFAGANSPASLASMPIRFALCDEIDRYPWTTKEGDPMSLIEQRQSSFPRRKMLLTSTPTLKGFSRIEQEFEESDKRYYYVPCPDCEESQVLKWGNLRWADDVKSCWYVCEHCGTCITESSKSRMLSRGEWRATNKESKVPGFHLNALYTPVGLGLSWLELAQLWVKAQNDVTKMQAFVNTKLAETWEDRSHSVDAHKLAARAEPYSLRSAPPGCLILTAGVDVQGDRLEVQILGFGKGGRVWVVDYVALPGDPSKDETWDSLTQLLNQPVSNAYGRELSISATAIDTGGHHTTFVYDYVRRNRIKRPMAIKGSSQTARPLLSGRPSTIDYKHNGKMVKGGVRLWTIGTDTGKSTLFAQLVGDENQDVEARKIHFSEGLTHEYFEQLVSEAYDPIKNKWIKRRGKRNEALDTAVYAMAASNHPEVRVNAMQDKSWDRLSIQLEQGEPQAIVSEPATVVNDYAPPKPRQNPGTFRRGGGWVTRW